VCTARPSGYPPAAAAVAAALAAGAAPAAAAAAPAPSAAAPAPAAAAPVPASAAAAAVPAAALHLPQPCMQPLSLAQRQRLHVLRSMLPSMGKGVAVEWERAEVDEVK